MGSIPTGGSDTPTRFRVGVFVCVLVACAPLVFRAPLVCRAARCARGRRPARWCSGRRVACLDGPGRCVCRWAAARPRDRHTRACGSEWSISRPALALPPPTGTAARPRVLQLARALRSLRRPRAPQPGPPVPPLLSAWEAMGVLHYTKPAGGVSPACRTLV